MSLTHLPPRSVVAHRGNRARAPENTLQAFAQAVELGVHAIELDVRLTRDGEAVVIHDATLDRTTDTAGPVAARTWDELRRVDAGARFSNDQGRSYPFRGREIRVPRLADVLAALPAVPIIVEVKEVEAAPVVARVILACGARDRCTVGAFAHEALVPFHGTGIARTASTPEVLRLIGPALLGYRHSTLPFQALSLPLHHRGIPLPLGALARSVAPAGVPVFAWTVNNPSVARRLWRRGLRGVLSDDPGPLLAASREP